MRVVVAGSRTIEDPRLVDQAMRESGFIVTEVVSGAARGVDQLGEAWAARHGVPVVRFPADWRRFGRSAGPRRNRAMLAYAGAAPEGGALVAVWDGISRGTHNTIETARAQGLALYVLYTASITQMEKSHSAGEGTWHVPLSPVDVDNLTRCW